MSQSFMTLEQFLSARLSRDGVTIPSWVGISSNAMVQEAISKTPVHPSDYPHDLADLSRCCATFAAAPWSLKALMLPRLTLYCEHGMNGWQRNRPSKPEPKPAPKFLGQLRRFVTMFRGIR